MRIFVDNDVSLARTRAVCIILAATLMIAGCSGSAPSTYDSLPQTVSAALATAKSQGFTWEVGVLRDGTITASEYEEAYDRYLSCAEKLGYTPDKPKYLDPVNGLQWESVSSYHGTGKAPDSKVRKCENRLGVIETPYLLTTPKRMDPRLLARFRECLDSHHLKFTGKEVNYNQFVENQTNAEFGHGPYMDCLISSADALFPNLIGVSVAR